MGKLLTVRQTAQTLRLNPQTIYRKISRGELSAIRLGRAIRFREGDLYPINSAQPSLHSTPKKLPSAMQSLFWDVNFESLTLHTPIILERILELGDLAAVHWLFEYVPMAKIANWVSHFGVRRLSAKSYNFWRIFLELDDALQDTAQKTAGLLGQTRWR